jgi:hypothetical protein
MKYFFAVFQKHKHVFLKAQESHYNSLSFRYFRLGRTFTINEVKFSSATAFPVMFKSVKFKLSKIKKASQNFVAL